MDSSGYQLLRVDLAKNGVEIELKISDDVLRDNFKRAFNDLPVTVRKGATVCALSATNVITTKVLELLADEIDSRVESEDAA